MRHLYLIFALALCSTVNAAEGSISVTLQGKWSGTTTDGGKITYDFDRSGSVTWYVGEPNFSKAFPNGLKAKYEIRVSDSMWQIDINGFDDPRFKGITFMGILEIIDSKSFKFEGRPMQRPKEFTKEAVVFRAEN